MQRKPADRQSLSTLCPHCAGTGFVALPFDPAALVGAISNEIGSANFTTSELVDHASRIEGPLRSAIGAMSPWQLGKALRKLQALDFDGLCIERIGEDRKRALWVVTYSRS